MIPVSTASSMAPPYSFGRRRVAPRGRMAFFVRGKPRVPVHIAAAMAKIKAKRAAPRRIVPARPTATKREFTYRRSASVSRARTHLPKVIKARPSTTRRPLFGGVYLGRSRR